MNSKYSNFRDIVGVDEICRGIDDGSTQFMVQSSTSNTSTNYQQATPYDNGFNTQQQIHQQIQYGYNATPIIGFPQCSPELTCNNVYTPINPSVVPYDTNIQYSQLQNDNVPANYKHRSDFSKRQRRKHTEMERIYDCDYPDCDKAYESISHLNTHREKKNHGDKKSIYDFEN